MKRYLRYSLYFLLLLATVAAALLSWNARGDYLPSGSIISPEHKARIYGLTAPALTEDGAYCVYSYTLAGDVGGLTLQVLTPEDVRVYLDGDCIFSYAVEEQFELETLIPIEKDTEGEALLQVICKAWDNTLVYSSLYLADSEVLQQHWNTLLWLQGLVTGCFIAMAFSAAAMYANKRSEKYLVSFFVYLIASAVLNLIAAKLPAIAAMGRQINTFHVGNILRTFLICLRFAACGQMTQIQVDRRLSWIFTGRGAVMLFLFLELMIRMGSIPRAVINFTLAFLGAVPLLLACGQRKKNAFLLLMGYAMALGVLLVLTILDRALIQVSAFTAAVRSLRLDNLPFALCAMLFISIKFAAKFKESEDLRESLSALTRTLDEKVKEQTDVIRVQQENRHAMMTNVFHDLRSPLFIMQGCLELLRGGGEEDWENIAIIKDRLDFVTKLTEELFYIAKLEDKQVEMACEAVELEAILRAVNAAYEQVARERGVKLCFVSEGPCRVWGEDTKLEQIFENLIINAIYYTPNGGAVDVRLRAYAGEAHVSVRDTGKGISKEEISKVFTRYYRVSTVNKHKSTGLGLGIAAELVRLHHGRIELESEPGKGTIFTVHLPLWEE